MNQLTFKIIWQDPDMVELEVYVGNDGFSGKTDVYTTYDSLKCLADSLIGFPKSVEEEVKFSAGEKDSYSYTGLRFYCYRKSGHTAFEAEIESNVATEYRPEEKAKLKLEVMFEANSLDTFIKDLNHMVHTKEGTAKLGGIEKYTNNIK